jgi:hypothetical protein
LLEAVKDGDPMSVSELSWDQWARSRLATPRIPASIVSHHSTPSTLHLHGSEFEKKLLLFNSIIKTPELARQLRLRLKCQPSRFLLYPQNSISDDTVGINVDKDGCVKNDINDLLEKM